MTFELRARRRATLVDDVIPREVLVRTEFYNDFLDFVFRDNSREVPIETNHFGINDGHTLQGRIVIQESGNCEPEVWPVQHLRCQSSRQLTCTDDQNVGPLSADAEIQAQQDVPDTQYQGNTDQRC